MAVKLAQGFQITSASPIDSRLTLSKAEMLSYNLNLMPEKYLAICTDNGKLYLFDKDSEPNSETGYFKSYEDVIDIPAAIEKSMSSEAGKAAMEEAVSSTLPGAIQKSMESVEGKEAIEIAVGETLPGAIQKSMSTESGKAAMEESISETLPGAIFETLNNEERGQEFVDNMFEGNQFVLNSDNKVEINTSTIATKEALESEKSERIADDAKKVDKHISGENGEAYIFNEKDGGGARFVHKDGSESFVGVNDGGENGLMAQIYADKLVDGKWQGAKIDVTNKGIYYTVGNKSFEERAIEDNEIITRKDLIEVEVPEYSMRKEENPGDYAAIYHLTKDGSDIGEAINIAKDQLLKTVEIETCTQKNVPIEGLEVGDKYMDFTFIVEKGEETHTYIAIKDMVKPYTAGNGIIITSENAITFDPDVLSTVDYVDGSITNTLTYVDQQDANEYASRVAGDNILQGKITAEEEARIAGDEARKLEILPVSAYGFDTDLRVNQQVNGSALIDKVIEATNTDKKQVVIKSGDYKYNVISIVNDETLGIKGFAVETMSIPMESLNDKPSIEKGIFLYNPSLGKTCTFYDKDFTSAEIQGMVGQILGSIDAEIIRAKAAEQELQTKKLDVLPLVDDPDDPGYGWEYHIPYGFDFGATADTITITIKTLTLDNKFTKMNFDNTLPSATQASAGLMNASDKVKVDKIDSLTPLAYTANINDLVQSSGDILILNCNI